MNEREELEQAIKRLESQRDTLGETADDAALAGLQQKLAELARSETKDRDETPGLQPTGERRLMTILFCDVAG